MLTDVRERVVAARPRGLVLSLEETPDLDGTSIEALADFAAEQERGNVTLVLARRKDPVLAALEAALGATTKTLLVSGSVDDAVGSLAPTLPGKESQVGTVIG